LRLVRGRAKANSVPPAKPNTRPRATRWGACTCPGRHGGDHQRPHRRRISLLPIFPVSSDTLWGLRWYEAALFLTGFGLAAIFPAVWLRAALSTAGAAFGCAGVQTGFDMSSSG
jgi:hypothetical protein